MPSWTPEQLHAYETRRKAPSAQPEQVVQDVPLGQARREKENPARILVRITSFRTRLLDPDNLCPKYFIDCLRYAKLIPNDREQDIELVVKQVKVNHETQERTEIEVI